jgi:hypothetical protein
MSIDSHITGIAYPRPFDSYALKLCESASRYLCIMSPHLDHEVFNRAELANALRTLARESRQTHIRILVSDARGIVGRGHRLLQLARRLPSTVQIRKLQEHPDWQDQTVVIRDLDGLLYKHGDSEEDAFYEPASRAAAQRPLELFNELWRLSVEDPELRSLSI